MLWSKWDRGLLKLTKLLTFQKFGILVYGITDGRLVAVKALWSFWSVNIRSISTTSKFIGLCPEYLLHCINES